MQNPIKQWKAGPNYSIQNTTVTKTGSIGWNTNVISEFPLSGVGVVEFYFNITKSKESWIMVGVAPPTFDQNRLDNHRSKGEGYFYNCHHGDIFSKTQRAYGKAYPGSKKIDEGQQIGVSVDFTDLTISFIVDGENLGTAFQFPKKTQLFPALLLMHAGDVVEWI